MQHNYINVPIGILIFFIFHLGFSKTLWHMISVIHVSVTSGMIETNLRVEVMHTYKSFQDKDITGINSGIHSLIQMN